jgi:hypothetical protein
VLWEVLGLGNHPYVFTSQGEIFTVPSSNHGNLPIGTTQYQLSADSAFGTQQEFIDLLSSAFDDWGEIIALTKPRSKFIASKMVKDIPITIYSEAWKSPLEVLLGEFPSTGQGNPTWTIHLCLGCVNNAASDTKAHNDRRSPPVKADPDAAESPASPPPIKPDPETTAPSSSRKRPRSYSDLLQELEEQRARTDQVVHEYEEQAERLALQLAHISGSEQFGEQFGAQSDKDEEDSLQPGSNDEKVTEETPSKPAKARSRGRPRKK